MKRLLWWICCLFCLCCLCGCGAKVQENALWPETEWTKDLPPFSSVVDSLYDKSKDGDCYLVISMKDVSYKEYTDYIEKVEQAGYTDEYAGQLIPDKEPNSYASFISGNKGICVTINWYADKYPARPLCDMQMQLETIKD